MKFFVARISIYASMLLLLAGCGGRIVDWASEQIDQGCTNNQHLARARSYIRSNRIYDQFTLMGAFSALWLSDGVREDYTRMHTYMRGKTEEEEKVFLRRQLAENDHFISFYVLSSNNITVGHYDSQWTVLLKIGNEHYSPVEVKKVELTQEYTLIFNKYYTTFTTPYLIRFNLQDSHGKKIINDNTKCIGLEFRSLKKEFMLTWPVAQRDYTMCHFGY